MLFPYTFVPHSMEKMQTFVDFIFYEVWCKAPTSGTFRLELFNGNLELMEVMGAFFYSEADGAEFFYGHVERIYGLFSALDQAQIDKLSQWYQGNNEIEKICENDSAIFLARYTDITLLDSKLSEQLACFFKGLYSQKLLGLAVLRQKVGDIDDHYKAFMNVNKSGKCPFCGISDVLGVNHTPREAYDHYLPKSLYPFNSINFRNLVPACHHCNSSYKTRKNVAFTPKDPTGSTQRRKVFYPFRKAAHRIDVTINLKRSDIDRVRPEDVELKFGPSDVAEEIDTWKDVYGIEERYTAKCLSPDAKAWLEEVLIASRNYGISHDAVIKTIVEQAKNDPFSNTHFLKKAFLDGCERRGIFQYQANTGQERSITDRPAATAPCCAQLGASCN